jgi:hypothetical protein
VALVVVVLGTAGCGSGLQVVVVLHPPVDDATGLPLDTSALRSVMIAFESEGVRDEHPIAIDRDQQVALAVEVDRSTPFRVDVWACETKDSCKKEDVAFRGCTPKPLDFAAETRPKVSVSIFLFPLDDPSLERCPAL